MPDSPGLFTMTGGYYWSSVVQVSGSDSSTTNTTATDITGLTFAASANTTYEIEAYLISTDSNGNGCKYAVGFGAAGATGSCCVFTNVVTKTSVSLAFMDLGTLDSTTLHEISGTKIGVWITAVVVVGANAGNITIQHAKVTSGTVTASIGSVMKIRQLANVSTSNVLTQYWDAVTLLNSTQTTNSTSLVDVSGLSYAAGANHSYEVEAYLVMSSSDTSGNKVTVGFSAAGAVGGVLLYAIQGALILGIKDGENLGGVSAAYCTLGGNTKVFIHLKALVVTGANAGNITIQQEKLTSGTSSVYAGSLMTIKQLA